MVEARTVAMETMDEEEAKENKTNRSKGGSSIQALMSSDIIDFVEASISSTYT